MLLAARGENGDAASLYKSWAQVAGHGVRDQVKVDR